MTARSARFRCRVLRASSSETRSGSSKAASFAHEVMRTVRMPRIVAQFLIVSICFAGGPLPAAHAELIATDRIDSSNSVPILARAHLNALMDRADVRAELQSHGVSAEEAKARVAALSDSEVEGLAQRFDSLPAGGGGFEAVLWVAFLVFVILLITDILGFTKVFPFTRPAK